MNDEIWQSIITDLNNNPRDLQTIPLRGTGKWFYAFANGETVFVENAHEEHDNNSNIQGVRNISREEFDNMLPIHIRRNNGEHVSAEATRTTRNQVYIYSIFHNCAHI